MPARLPIKLISLKTHFLCSKQPSRSFTHTVKYSVYLAFNLLASTFPNNTLSFTSSIKSRSLVLMVGYVCQLLNPATLQLSNSLGSHSNCYEALGQMLLINQWLDKLLQADADFVECGIVPPPPICHLQNLSYPLVMMMRTLASSTSM